MKPLSTTSDLEILTPNRDRVAFTDMLIAGETIVPGTKQDLLIDEPFFYSHEWDVEKALKDIFTIEWRKREYAAAVRYTEYYQNLDAAEIFKLMVKSELGRARSHANNEIARCWMRLLRHRPEYVDRCPWRLFQGDTIWETLQDEKFLHTITHTPLQLAEKMDLKAMSSPDWDEVLKIVPELAARARRKNMAFMAFSSKHSLVTVAAYPPSEIPERYYPTRELHARDCLLCIHCSAKRDLRLDKRYIVPLEHGECSLKKEVRTCNSYERIPELRAANMNPTERFYHHMYTRKYLQKVLRWFFHDPELVFDASKNHRFAEEWADMIVAYEKNMKGKTEK